MSTNVYNIVWADDEIDNLIDQQVIKDLNDIDINIVGLAHNGRELDTILSNSSIVDAVIVDANFNESSNDIKDQRDTSGLVYARYLYRMKYECKIPFFLFTNRSDELLRKIHEYNPDLLADFPRHKRWFSKSGQGEYEEMLQQIKEDVDEINSTGFVIRNKFIEELNAASVFDGTKDFIYDFLVHEHENRLEEMVEPFFRVRRALEKMFDKCAKLNLIPPIDNDMNGCASYFKHTTYCPKDANGQRVKQYEMIDKKLMPKPLASSLFYIVDIVQDDAHSKEQLKLKVDKYYFETNDTLLLRSVVYILIDCIKWFTLTALNHPDEEDNAEKLWKKV